MADQQKKLGQILRQHNLLTPEGLDRALRAQRIQDGRLGTQLVSLGLVSADEVGWFLARQQNVPCAERGDFVAVPPEVISLLPARVCIRNWVFPLRVDGRRLYLAMRDPRDLALQDSISFAAGLRVVPYVVAEIRLAYYLELYYGMAREEPLAAYGDDRGPADGWAPAAASGPFPAPGSEMGWATPTGPPRPAGPADGPLPPAGHPGPAAEEEPGPAAEEEPGPAVEEEPGPAVEEEPGPAVEEEPGPAAEEELYPEAEPGPAPPPAAASQEQGDEDNGLIFDIGGATPAPESGSGPDREDDPSLVLVELDSYVFKPEPEREGAPSGEQRTLALPSDSGLTRLVNVEELTRSMEQAGDQAEIARLLVEPFLAHTGLSVLFFVDGQRAVGLAVSGVRASAERVRGLQVDLERSSLLRRCLETRGLVRGQAETDPVQQQIAEYLGKDRPGEVYVAPVALGSRVVNLLCVQTRPGCRFEPAAPERLKQICQQAARGYARLIRRRKSRGGA